MNKLTTIVLSICAFTLMSFPVVAADNEIEASSDTSKNPITGTVTKTKKWKKKHKHTDGTTHTQEANEKVKHKTDGSVEKKAEQDETVDPNH